LLMVAPTGGDSFTGVSGFVYSAGSGAQLEIGGSDVRRALQRNWVEIPYPVPPTVAQLPIPSQTRIGVEYYTSDQGVVVNTGTAWVPVGSGGGGLTPIASGTILGNSSGISAIPTAQTALPSGVTTAAGGQIFGSTDTQTLTNKTVDGGSNTLTNLPASQLVGSISVTAITGNWGIANGGTGVSTLSGVLLGNGTSPISSAAGTDISALFTGGAATSAYYLAADGTRQIAAGGGAGGANTQVQFNNSGVFAGDSGFTYAGSGAATLTASLTVPTITAATRVSAGRIDVTSTTTATNGFALPTGNTPTAYSNGAARFQWTSSGITLLAGNFVAGTIGQGLQVKEGTNAKMGVATLVAGTVTVSNTAVTANSRIYLTCQSLGTVSAPSALCISARTAGTSFTILASQNTDTSVIAWQIVEPAP